MYLYGVGLSDQTILGYQCDPNLIAVYCSCDPSLLICCDVIAGRHSAWIVKPASDQVRATFTLAVYGDCKMNVLM